MPLACRAATEVLHFCLSLAIFSTVPRCCSWSSSLLQYASMCFSACHACAFLLESNKNTLTDSQYVQVISPHFRCDPCQFASFVHSAYIPESYSGFAFCTSFKSAASLRLSPLAIILFAWRSLRTAVVFDSFVAVSVTKFFLQDRVVGPMPNPQLGGPGIFYQGFLTLDKLPTKTHEP